MKLFRIHNRWSLLRALIGWLACLAALYMFAALIGSITPANYGWVQPQQGIPVFVETNGVHVSIIVPVSVSRQDLSDLVRPEHLSDTNLYGTHLMIGWGHKGVYRNARTWADVRSGDVASAATGSDKTTLHIYHLVNPKPLPDRKMFIVTPFQYRKIILQIRASFKTGPDGKTTAYPAYGPSNIFYDAHGNYSAFNTCNNWTGRVLRNAGIRVGVWTPFAGGVMRWF